MNTDAGTRRRGDGETGDMGTRARGRRTGTPGIAGRDDVGNGDGKTRENFLVAHYRVVSPCRRVAVSPRPPFPRSPIPSPLSHF